MNTLEEAARRFTADCRFVKRLSDHTVKAYETDLKQFIRYLAETFPELPAPEDVGRSTVHGYVLLLNEKYEVRTVKRKCVALKAFFSFLELEELISRNPFDKMRLKSRAPKVLPEVMSLSEIRSILRAAYTAEIHDNWCKDSEEAELIRARDIAILELLFATGLRVQELCNLKGADFDRERLSLKVHGKGNKERCIYVANKEVLSALARYCGYKSRLRVSGGYLFCSRFSDRLSPQAVRNLVRKYARLAGVKKNITPHTFRHTFASLLLEEGVDIKYIQDFLGHSSISTTQIYLHIAPDSARNVLSEMHPRRRLSSADWLC